MFKGERRGYCILIIGGRCLLKCYCSYPSYTIMDGDHCRSTYPLLKTPDPWRKKCPQPEDPAGGLSAPILTHSSALISRLPHKLVEQEPNLVICAPQMLCRCAPPSDPSPVAAQAQELRSQPIARVSSQSPRLSGCSSAGPGCGRR